MKGLVQIQVVNGVWLDKEGKERATAGWWLAGLDSTGQVWRGFPQVKGDDATIQWYLVKEKPPITT